MLELSSLPPEVQRPFQQLLDLLGPLREQIRYGQGDPETFVTAPVGVLYLRLDGGANTSLYVKESGAGNTGWIAK